MDRINFQKVEIGTFELCEFQRMFKDYHQTLKKYGKDDVVDFNVSWKDLESNILNVPNFKVFLFKNTNNEPVGFVCLQDIKYNEYENDVAILYISDFYIRQEYRRQGIGTYIINELIKQYGIRVWFWYVIKDNKPAIKFWNRISSTLLTPIVNSSCKVDGEDGLKAFCNKYVAAPSNIWDECLDVLMTNKKSIISRSEALNLLRNYLNFTHFADNSKIAEELVKQAWRENYGKNI